MKENGYEAGKPYRKSARIVGDVMGKYHPHGDQAIYDAMVRMAQDFSMRLPLVDGQGNFGSMDGDRAAAMRYTEGPSGRSAHETAEDIDSETVDFQPNYDETIVRAEGSARRLSEPSWSMAPAASPSAWRPTSRRTIWAKSSTPVVPTGQSRDHDRRDHRKYVPGPDFPTGGLIMGRTGFIGLSHRARFGGHARPHPFEEIRKDR